MRRSGVVSLALLLTGGACAFVGCVADSSDLAPTSADASDFDQAVPAFDAGSRHDANVADTSVPDTSVADTNAPDTNLPDTNVPDTNAPDTNVADTNAPDTNVPDTNVPDTNVPDTNVPDTNVPDAGPVFTHFVYVGTSTANQMQGWGVNTSTGALTPVNQTPDGGASYGVATGGNPLASCVSGSYLYTSNSSGSVSGFTITHGVLSPIDADPGTAGHQDFPAGPTARFIVATSSFVFTANEGGPSVSAFQIGAGGFLTSLGATTLPNGADVNGIAVDPTGKLLFTFNYGLSTVSVFKISGAGALTLVDQDADAGQQDFALPTGAFIGTVHPTLPVVYVVGASKSTKVAAFSYDVNGILAAVGTPQTTGSNGNTNPLTFGVTVDPTGAFLYAVSYEDTAVNVYTLDPTTGAPVAAGSATGPSSLRAASVDPGGKFLYVAGDGVNVTGYSITAGTGALTKLTPSVNGGVGNYTMPITISP